MASPFSIFRRHQKVMLAVLTLLAMFAFVFLDPLLEAFRGDVPDNVVVTTRRYGNLREQDVHNLIRQRQVVLNVLERALVAGGFPPQFASFQLQQFLGPPTEEAVVNSWLHAQRAESLGMVVDDRAVNDFLNAFLEQYTDNRVQIADLRDMLKGDQIPQRVLFAALRNELLARQLRQSFQTSLWGVPPMQRWDYYLRLNRRATIELVPVPVVDFMDQVEEPGERVLRAFFEEHKDRLWRPDMPEPAFREPKRIALQYFKAEFDAFVDPKSVTDEEVAEYYEKNKDFEFVQPQAPPPRKPDAPDDVPRDDVEPPAEPPAEEPGEAPPIDPEPMDDAQPEPDESVPSEPADETEEKDAPADEPMEAPAEPETTEPAEEPAEPAEVPDEAEEASPEPSDDAGVRPSAQVMFTSFVAEEGESDDLGEADAEQPEAPDDAETPALAEPEQPSPTDDEPAAPEPSTLDGQPAGVRFHVPLSEVEDEIRTRLARRKTHERIEQLLRSLSTRMQRYQDQRTLHEVRLETDPTAQPPAELDLGEIAREHGLKSFETELISPWEARLLDIGESLVDGSEPFVRHAFEVLPPFQPAISQAEQDYFLFWKTKQQEERVPDWQEANVKEQVLEAWRLVQARELARAHAETLAERVRESGRTLEKFFADDSKYEVVQAGPFSWMTYGDVPPLLAREPPRISEVEGVDYTGQRFMGDVFALDEGQLGVTMNQPETVAFLVRVEGYVPPTAVLWEGFLVDDFSKYAAAGAPNFRQMQAAWQEQLEQAAGLEWKREPWRGRDDD